MLTKKTWTILKQKQAELGQLIVQKSEPKLEWVSRFNAERLKLCLLVEVGEFANEIKSFKAWQKKKEIDWEKAKEELIDCLCFFLDLSSIYQVEISDFSFSLPPEAHFNQLLLEFFTKTNDLLIIREENFYPAGKVKINDPNTYYDWLKIFQALGEKLTISEPELLTIYFQKNEKNQQRASEK